MEDNASAWDGSAKLADFGLSRQACAETGDLLEPFKGLSGTLGYMAPEIILGKKAGKPIDVYAFGATMWELHHHEQCHAEMTRDELLVHMQLQGSLPRSSSDLSPLYLAIMTACTRFSPAARPSFAQLEQAMQLLLADQHQPCSRVQAACKLMRIGI